MNTRTGKRNKIIRKRNMFISIFSIVLVFLLSLFIANRLSLIIYRESIKEKTISISSKEVSKEVKKENIENENFEISKKTVDNTLIVFQGGVFKDLEQAENFKDKIEEKTISAIVNDDKYERLIIGVSNRKQSKKLSEIYKKNNVQFVKHVLKLPNNVKYNKEIIEIVDLFTQLILDNQDVLHSEKKIDIIDFKKEVSLIKATYGEVGSYEEFNGLKEMIEELEDEIDKKELESILEFIYFNFKKYKI